MGSMTSSLWNLQVNPGPFQIPLSPTGRNEMNGDEKKKRVVPVSFLLLRYPPRLARSQSEFDRLKTKPRRAKSSDVVPLTLFECSFSMGIIVSMLDDGTDCSVVSLYQTNKHHS
jgi:hypothetical protein